MLAAEAAAEAASTAAGAASMASEAAGAGIGAGSTAGAGVTGAGSPFLPQAARAAAAIREANRSDLFMNVLESKVE